MTAQELIDKLSMVAPDTPVVLWDDSNGRHGDAQYVTTTDGEATICGALEAER